MIRLRVRAYDFEDATDVTLSGDHEAVLEQILLNVLERNEWIVEEVEEEDE